VETVNKHAVDSESPLTEDEARTLFAMKLRNGIKKIIADAAGCDVADVVIKEAPKKVKKAKAKVVASGDPDEDDEDEDGDEN
jgi:hypothetical protein